MFGLGFWEGFGQCLRPIHGFSMFFHGFSLRFMRPIIAFTVNR